ncbi:MAG: heavy metal-responsive transcriptional regulator [Gemmatimonadetes bacterium]|nr:heavy metal-responsive transcriptional regulator [Gemmatimonadota bacterium]
MTDRDHFFIGELAERTGMSRDAIRYYETMGVLPEAARSESGYRVYGVSDVERLGFIAQAQTLGLTLEEIAEVLGMVDEGRQPCVHVKERLALRLEETRERIRSMRALERRLERALARAGEAAWLERGCRCRIIEVSGHRPGGGPGAGSRRRK